MKHRMKDYEKDHGSLHELYTDDPYGKRAPKQGTKQLRKQQDKYRGTSRAESSVVSFSDRRSEKRDDRYGSSYGDRLDEKSRQSKYDRIQDRNKSVRHIDKKTDDWRGLQERRLIKQEAKNRGRDTDANSIVSSLRSIRGFIHDKPGLKEVVITGLEDESLVSRLDDGGYRSRSRERPRDRLMARARERSREPSRELTRVVDQRQEEIDDSDVENEDEYRDKFDVTRLMRIDKSSRSIKKGERKKTVSLLRGIQDLISNERQAEDDDVASTESKVKADYALLRIQRILDGIPGVMRTSSTSTNGSLHSLDNLPSFLRSASQQLGFSTYSDAESLKQRSVRTEGRPSARFASRASPASQTSEDDSDNGSGPFFEDPQGSRKYSSSASRCSKMSKQLRVDAPRDLKKSSASSVHGSERKAGSALRNHNSVGSSSGGATTQRNNKTASRQAQKNKSRELKELADEVIRSTTPRSRAKVEPALEAFLETIEDDDGMSVSTEATSEGIETFKLPRRSARPGTRRLSVNAGDEDRSVSNSTTTTDSDLPSKQGSKKQTKKMMDGLRKLTQKQQKYLNAVYSMMNEEEAGGGVGGAGGASRKSRNLGGAMDMESI